MAFPRIGSEFLIGFVISWGGLAGFPGCVSTPTNPTSTVTYGNVKRYLIKGKTNQAEVQKLFGAPSLITKNGEGNEVWTYSRPSAGNLGGYSNGVVLFGANESLASGTASSFDLILTFSMSTVLEDYSMVASPL